jgi:O-antigen ligase
LLIPTQLGRHFWFDWSLVLGIRVDYLSPTLYLVDLIWLGLLLINFFLKFKKIKIGEWFNFRNFLIIGFVLVNILLAKDWQIAGYKWLRVLQLVWFIGYVAKNKKIVGQMLKKIIPIWIGVEGFLAIGQISKGGSLNGIWWWLGERTFNFNTIGIAQMSVVGNGLVRVYGTFSHPNSLAGFLLVSLIWWTKYKSSPNPSFDKAGLKFSNIFWWVVSWLALTGIILTGSRTIWLLTGIGLIWFLGKNFSEVKNKWKSGLLILVLLIVVFKIIDFNYPINNFLGGWDENGLIKRGQLNWAAINMIKESPIFGVGAGNFLVNLPEFQKNNQIFWLQPAHNILLLLISEFGFLGLGILIWFLGSWWSKKRQEKEFWWMIGVVCLSGMVDHYWLTLPQNMWLLALVLGMI